MDINGAKALKERLGMSRQRRRPPAPVRVEVPADAPPVYHWLGARQPEAGSPVSESEGEPKA